MRPPHDIRYPLVAAALLAITAGPAAAQHVPIHGLTGTMALPGNVDKIYDGVNTIVVKAVDGTSHVMHVTKDTKVHGGALASLERGTPIVVHYTVKGASESSDEIDNIGPSGLKYTEGVVTAVDRVHKTITVAYPGGAAEKLRLTHHASADSGTPSIKGKRVVVYYENEAGQKVAHYFKRKS